MRRRGRERRTRRRGKRRRKKIEETQTSEICEMTMRNTTRPVRSLSTRGLEGEASCGGKDYILIDGDCGKMWKERVNEQISPQDLDSIDKDHSFFFFDSFFFFKKNEHKREEKRREAMHAAQNRE